MTQRTFAIIGATSVIARAFAEIAARNNYKLLIVSRNATALDAIAKDIEIRYKVSVTTCSIDLTDNISQLIHVMEGIKDLDLFIAHSDFTDNEHLTANRIEHLINTNIKATSLICTAYLNTQQTEHNLIVLSSVAACRGRSKNSLYGASKAFIDLFLEGLQQSAPSSQTITIARLGFIDTHQTYGVPGVFYAAPPESCARACWRAYKHKVSLFYYPKFWWLIMAIIRTIPKFIYKKMGAI